MINNRIPEIEINFSNVCGAECIMCSRAHGYGNSFFMSPEVFVVLLNQLKGVDFDMLQTSGNGEAFLNENYLNYISELRQAFPRKPIWTYNNFSMVTPERAHKIVDENLFSKIHVRVDSMRRWIFERSSNLNQNQVFTNLKYFLSINRKVPVMILYNNIVDYYLRCQQVLGQKPIRNYFTEDELSLIPDDEEQEIREYFQAFSKDVKLSSFRVRHSLWGERQGIKKNLSAPCPKFKVISNCVWVCPNGDVDVCCYDDSQRLFVAGNIMEEHLISIFHGEARAEILRKVKNREWTEYPCIDPECCKMGDNQ